MSYVYYNAPQEHGQANTATYTVVHPPCCTQTVLHLQNQLSQSQNQLRTVQTELNRERTESEAVRQRMIDVDASQQEVKREIEQVNANLLRELELRESLSEQLKIAGRTAEDVINDLRMKLARERGETTQIPEGKPIGQVILELAFYERSAQRHMSGNRDQAILEDLERLQGQNIKFQLEVQELKKANDKLSRQVDDKTSKVSNLKNALEPRTEDQELPRGKRSRKEKLTLITSGV